MLSRLAVAARPTTASQSPAIRNLRMPSAALSSSHQEPSSLARAPRFDFARINLMPIQRKPAISSPGDACEREADQVADHSLTQSLPRNVIQSRPEAPASAATNPVLDAGAAVSAAQHGGAAMPGNLLSFFQPRLGYDFSNVRLHTDSHAAEGARAVQARAYTTGHDIVFGAGQYAPHTAPGKHLLAHELTHVVQQHLAPGGPGLLQRVPTTAPPTSLDQYSAADKQKLKVDPDALPLKLTQFFGLNGTLNAATNVDPDFDIEAPTIEALKDDKVKSGLYQGLRFFALSAFDLLPEADGKAHTQRLNMVHVENLNLIPFGGPNTSFRFTCTGSTVKGMIKVRILIEGLDLPARSMADVQAAPGIEKSKATPYGLTHDSTVTSDQWEKVLRSLGRLQESLIMRVRDITFETSAQQTSPKGESALFHEAFDPKTKVWTKKIILFQKMIASSDSDFATTLAHEMGHAIDAAPSEGAAGPISKGEVHNDPKFLEAAKKDGGRSKAITKYAATDDFEFFAENLSLFIQQPDTLRILRPNIYAFFKDYQYGALKDPKLNPNYVTPGKGPQLSNQKPVF